MTNAIEFCNVSKKFRKGEDFDSLRDFVPNMFKGIMPWNRKKTEELHGKEFWAVRDVSFELGKGETLGIIGPNGAGKSTILKILSRILKPTAGEITIKGKLSALLEAGAGFHPDLTGRENIYLSGAIIGMKKKEIDKKLDSIVAFSELEDFIDTPIKRYSSGMHVRLGFAVAAHMDPQILLIDEVLAVGDTSFQKKCTLKIQEIRKSGITIIFISHDLELVRRLCPNSIFLNKGHISYYGESGKAVEQYLKSVAEKYSDNVISSDLKTYNLSSVHIQNVTLFDESGKRKSEFKTGDFIRVEISYNTKEKVNNPTFTVAIFLNDYLVADMNSRFEHHDIEYIYGDGKIDLIIKDLLLLPGLYEARAHLADKDGISIYDVKSSTFFVKENKRSVGQYYQPHYWDAKLGAV